MSFFKDCLKFQRLRLLRDSSRLFQRKALLKRILNLPWFFLTEGIQNVDLEASLVSCLCLEDIGIKKLLKEDGSILFYSK